MLSPGCSPRMQKDYGKLQFSLGYKRTALSLPSSNTHGASLRTQVQTPRTHKKLNKEELRPPHTQWLATETSPRLSERELQLQCVL